ncbi:MAG TPA: triple tyrosine motif-containing protein [Saprospiraceae bacterium]|nr:triple tyrosine motif-containing protein [Saprospiraceae bacterium]
MTTTTIRQVHILLRKEIRRDTTGWNSFSKSGTHQKDFVEILLILLALVLLPSVSNSQSVNIGVPPIWNYSRKIYKAGTQNWDAAQDRSRQIYFANNDGLLRFDGNEWTIFPVSNHTIVRSVAIDQDNRIYTGAQSEIGYFYPGANGVLTYHSLIGLLPPDHRTFEDVWDIVFYEKRVFFRTNRSVFEYNGEQIKIHEIPGDIASLAYTSLGLLLQKGIHEILIFEDGAFRPYRNIHGLESAITGTIPWTNDTILFSSLKNGMFYMTDQDAGRWNTAHDDVLIEKRIYTSTRLSNGNIALGTSLDGLIVVDKQRRMYRHLNKKHGLQNNNILNAFCDHAGNLWLGLDNGIDCVVLDSKFTSIFPDGELHATGYSAAVFDHQLYLGVSNGAYIAPWQSYYDPEQGPFFQRVEHGEGQVWGFTKFEHELLMGHHEGAFQIRDNMATSLTTEPGTWLYVELNDHYMLAGTYTGLVLYKKEDDQWVYDRKINGIQESCRIMVKDADGSIWVSHPYRGLYQVVWNEENKYDPQIRFFDQSGGLPSNLNNYVFRIAGKAVFGTEKGVYAFDKIQNRFVPDSSFNNIMGAGHRVKAMKEDIKGNIWYAMDDEVGILMIDDHGVKKEVLKKILPELGGKLVGGFEFIYPIDEYNVLFGTEEGFVHYDAHADGTQNDSLYILLDDVRAGRNQDSVLFGGYFLPGNIIGISEPHELTSNLNSLSFSFSATDYKTPQLVQYRTKLEGLEDEWSPWSTDTDRDFTSLGAGTYTFHAQARIRDGIESNVVSYVFRIPPPWYLTTTAKVMYALCILGFFSGFIFRQRIKFESEKAKLTFTHQEKEAIAIREVEQSKAALSEIQHEKLEVEIKYKNQELALTTMHLVQKAEILLAVQEGLHQIREKSPDQSVKKEVQQLLNMVNFDVKLDEDWEHFAHHFDQVHVDFLKHLRERFPQLSTSDLKLCAYLRMNLSTKEIAPLLNISVRGVEGSRYRLRKKLDLSNDANLTEFILRLSPTATIINSANIVNQ